MKDVMRIEVGDAISAMGYTFTVGKILHQVYNGDLAHSGGSDCWGYDVEFMDDNGGYHHWKQNQDGGEVVRSDEMKFVFNAGELKAIAVESLDECISCVKSGNTKQALMYYGSACMIADILSNAGNDICENDANYMGMVERARNSLF